MPPKTQKLTLTTTGDSLQSLPCDDAKLSFKEKNMMDLLYPREDFVETQKNDISSQNTQNDPTVSQNVQNVQNVQNQIVPTQNSNISNMPSLKTVIFSTVLFYMLNTPTAEQFINRISKNDSPTYRLLMKTIIFAVTMFVVSNISITRFPFLSTPSLQPTLPPQPSQPSKIQ